MLFKIVIENCHLKKIHKEYIKFSGISQKIMSKIIGTCIITSILKHVFNEIQVMYILVSSGITVSCNYCKKTALHGVDKTFGNFWTNCTPSFNNA